MSSLNRTSRSVVSTFSISKSILPSVPRYLVSSLSTCLCGMILLRRNCTECKCERSGIWLAWEQKVWSCWKLFQEPGKIALVHSGIPPRANMRLDSDAEWGWPSSVRKVGDLEVSIRPKPSAIEVEDQKTYKAISRRLWGKATKEWRRMSDKNDSLITEAPKPDSINLLLQTFVTINRPKVFFLIWTPSLIATNLPNLGCYYDEICWCWARDISTYVCLTWSTMMENVGGLPTSLEEVEAVSCCILPY